MREVQLTPRKGEPNMQYLVQMKVAAYGRPATQEEGAAFIEHYIFPSLEMCKKMQEENRVLAGGPMSGTIGIAMIVEAGSALELDELIENAHLASDGNKRNTTDHF